MLSESTLSSVGPELQNTDLHRLLNLLYDLILERGFAEDIVWSYAGLTTVHVLSPGYASGEKKQHPNQNTYAIHSSFHSHLVSQCIRYFAYCYGKTSGNSNWRKEGVILAHSWRVLHAEEGGHGSRTMTLRSHGTTAREERATNTYAQFAFFFFHPELGFRVGLPTSLSLI